MSNVSIGKGKNQGDIYLVIFSFFASKVFMAKQ